MSPKPVLLLFEGLILPPSLPLACSPCPPALPHWLSGTLCPGWGGTVMPSPAAAFLPWEGFAQASLCSEAACPILPPAPEAASHCLQHFHNPDSLELAAPLLLHPCFPSETAFFSSLSPPNFQLHIQKIAARLSSPAQLSTLLQICSYVLPGAIPYW